MVNEIGFAVLGESVSCTVSMYVAPITCEALSTLFELHSHNVWAVLPWNQDPFPKF